MSSWIKTLLTMIAGIVGGGLGILVSFYIIVWVVSSSPLFLLGGLFIVGLCPICGAFAAMRAGTLAGRFLDRYD